MNLVFIHVGQKNADYVEHSINQAIIFNSTVDFFLISTEELYSRIKDKIYKKINFVDYSKLKKSSEHVKFLSNTKLDKCWNEGFWLYTTERFFYLENFCKLYKLNNIFHLENDVMIYLDLKEKLDVFHNNYQIGLTFETDRCIPGFVYFKDYSYLSLITNFIYKKNRFFFQKKLNDMELLSLFFKKNKKEKNNINILPTTIREITNLKNIKKVVNLKLDNNYELFNGIFDAAYFGLNLDGFDKTGVFKNKNIDHKDWIKNSIIDIEKFQINFETINNLKVPYIKFNERKIKIFNLHIHSKNLLKYMSNYKA